VNITHLFAFEFAQGKKRRRNKVLTVEKSSEPLHYKGIAFSIRQRRKDVQIQIKYISANYGKSYKS